MRSKSIKLLSIILIALLGYIVAKSYYPLLNFSWDGFELVTIKSSIDNVDQFAYFHSTSSQNPMPLVISLHSWGASYNHKDHIALLSKKKDLNYIHPDFRGPNYSQAGCLSEIVLNDIR